MKAQVKDSLVTNRVDSIAAVPEKEKESFTIFGHNFELPGVFHHHPDSVKHSEYDQYRDSVVYHKLHFKHLKKYHSGLYHAHMKNKDLRELFDDIQKEAGVSFTYVGGVDVYANLDIETFSLNHVVDEATYRSGMLAVKEQNRYIVYGKGAEDIVGDKKVLYTYHPQHLDHTEIQTQATKLGVTAKMYPVESLNAIMLEGTLSDIKETVSKFRIVDFKPIRVSIELLIVEYSHGDQFSWGIDVTSGQTGRLSDINYNPGAGIDFSYSFLGQLNPNFKANLRALVEKEYANILTNPHVVTTNNEKATIEIKEKRYVQLQTASINGLTTNLQSIDAGISLDVTPVVMSNDDIQMTVKGNSSDFLISEAEGEINTLTNAINTKVMVKNGETLIIGGLIEAEEADGVSGVPILRYIPVLNLLFRNKTKVKNYLETVIYITPYISPLKNETLHQSSKEYKKASKRMKSEDKKLSRKGIRKLF
jgi:type II secretory pathway component GspD/PulD (secretin)